MFKAEPILCTVFCCMTSLYRRLWYDLFVPTSVVPTSSFRLLLYRQGIALSKNRTYSNSTCPVTLRRQEPIPDDYTFVGQDPCGLDIYKKSATHNWQNRHSCLLFGRTIDSNISMYDIRPCLSLQC